MANLREIQRRMSSIKSTMQITRTMEMISTARIQKALLRAEDACIGIPITCLVRPPWEAGLHSFS